MFELSEFKADLKNQPPEQILYKYLFSKRNWYFETIMGLEHVEAMNASDNLQQLVSESFETNFMNVQLVGSAKTGFSMDPNQALREFNDDESDLDVAVISGSIFSSCWQSARHLQRTKRIQKYCQVTNGIFNGYIPYVLLDNVQEVRQKVNNFSDNARQKISDNLRIYHTVNFRIYRSWDDLQDYHLRGINKAIELGQR